MGLLMMEVGLRVVRQFLPVDLLTRSNGKPGKRYPGQLSGGQKLNNFGFRGENFSVPKARRFRIAALGDSFAYGAVPYQYNYLFLLEQSLRAEGLDVELFNFGIPSIGPREYLSMLRHEVLRFHPDLVVVSFFVGNDITESLPSQGGHWFERFCVYRFGKYFYGLLTSLNKWPNVSYVYHDDRPFFKEPVFLRIEKERSVVFQKDGVVLRKSFQEVQAIIKEMDAICRKNGVTLAFVLIPDQMQVDPKLQQQLSKRFPGAIPAGQMQWNAPNVMLGQCLSKFGIPYVDLLSAFQSKGELLYKPRDTHWNITGNRLASEKIKATVVGLLPKE